MTTEITDPLYARTQALKLYGLLVHWDEIKEAPWLALLIEWEESECRQRSLERRLHQAKLGRFKSLSQFDWTWPKRCDQTAIEECMQLKCIKEATNVIFCGPNGVGKSTIACNIGYQAVLKGHTVVFATAGQLLNELASQDGDNALRRRIQHYVKPQLLLVDEVGYVSYSNRHADLLFEIISRRYQEKPTMITTNKPFSEWNEIVPNASCVVSLIDRLVHQSEIISIEAESFRLKEAKEQNETRKKMRVTRQPKKSEEKRSDEF